MMWINILACMPELIVACTSLLMLLIGVWAPHLASRAMGFMAMTGLLAAGAVQAMMLQAVLLPNEPLVVWSGLSTLTPWIALLKILVMGIAFLYIWMLSASMASRLITPRYEAVLLVLWSVLGMMVTLSANDLLVLYLGVELQALCFYVLAASEHHTRGSNEAGMKYFILGAFASGLLLYGMAWIYGFTGTMQFDRLAELYHNHGSQAPASMGVLIGLVLLMVGLLFKCSAAPFHVWTPDVYQGAPTVVTALFASIPKLAAVGVLVRVLYGPFAQWVEAWQQVIIAAAMLSMLVGALGAMRQSSMKRLLAYGAIGHAGYMLSAIAAHSSLGVQAVTLYMLVYATLSLGMFACILYWRSIGGTDHIDEMGGIATTHPWLAGVMAVLLLSMAGIPPLAGFFAKYYVFWAVLEAKLYGLALLGVLSSVLAAYYYLRVLKVLYVDKAVLECSAGPRSALTLVATFTALANGLLVLAPGGVIAFLARMSLAVHG